MFAILVASLLFAPLAQAQNPSVVTEIGRPGAVTTITCTDGTASSDSTERNIFCSLAEQVIDEVAARAMTDIALQTNIDDEETARIGGDNTEAQARQTADIAEEMARTTADTALGATDIALGTRITDETMARTTADTALGATDIALGTRITGETMARTTEDTALGTRITGETTTRMAADIALGNSIDENVVAIQDLNQKVDKLEAELSAGIAMSLALQAPAVSPGKRLNLSIGAGTYNGEQAVAVSVGVRVDDRWSLNGGVGYGASRSDFGARIGATVEF